MSEDSSQAHGAQQQPHNKSLLTVPEQIAHLKSKGVTFTLCTETEATDYLRSGNNLLRTSSYRKLFPVQDQGPHVGKYLGLDFEHLRILSSLDRQLRECLLPIAIDVEHFARVRLLNKCEGHGEDGYAIVEDFLAQMNHKGRSYISGNLKGRSNGDEKHDEYSGDLVAHYYNTGIPIWVLLEAVEFGTLNSLYLFCANRWDDEEMRQEHYVLRSTQGLRNACAHNSCILNGVSRTEQKASTDVNALITASLNKHGLKRTKSRRARLSNLRTVQIASTLYAAQLVCTRSETKARHARSLEALRGSWEKSRPLFEGNNVITSFFDFLLKLVGIWAPAQP